MCRLCGNPTLTHPDGFIIDDAFAGTSGSSVNSAPKPVATVAQLADYLVNGFWQYAGESAHHWGTNTISYNINALTTAEKFLAQSALNGWHEVANLNFVQTTGAANITFTHNGSMTAYESDNYTGSGVTTSATVNISQDWIATDGGANDGKTGIDSYGYQTYVHEIGHALGLGHQGPYNGSASYSTGATYANDSWQYSVMSYFSQPDYDASSYRYVVTPQMADIYAVAFMYGAATTRTGDTVYGFNSTAGSIFNFISYSQAPALTIYDSGGNDTLDASGYSNAQVLDLHPGSFSSIGGLVRNIGIATTTLIEVAIGGSGNDSLIASESGSILKGKGGSDSLTGGAGIDTLFGGAGIDTLRGNGGADIYVFASGDSSATSGQHDLILDFAVGIDRIDLTGIDGDTSTPGIIDGFRFLATSIFDGLASAIDYFFDAVRGVTVLQGDVNGDRAADFAIDLNGNLTLTSADFTSETLLVALNLTGTGVGETLTGGALGDTLSGLGGNDTLIGNAGNDSLDGGTGADTMIGGTGNDTYVVDNAGDVVMESSGAAFVVPAGWTLKGTADFNSDGDIDVVVTNGSANQLWLLGNGAVQSTVNLPVLGSAWQVAGIGDLDGDGDKDILYKFQYDATVECGVFMNGAALAGQDQVFNKVADAVSPLSASNQGNDTVLSSISYTLGNGVENLTLASGAGAIDGTGNALANAITGNEGANRIAGLGGVDSMTGNGGADTFVFASYLNGLATVTDFAPGIDVLEILAAGFGGGLTPGAAAALVTADSAVTASHAGTTGYFIFDNTGTGAGTVYWDPNGGTGDDAIALVALLGVTSLSPSDFHLV